MIETENTIKLKEYLYEKSNTLINIKTYENLLIVKKIKEKILIIF
jgi:hypothetical protein